MLAMKPAWYLLPMLAATATASLGAEPQGAPPSLVTMLHVSPTGSDDGDGSMARPF
jgi:hypothetical protein